MNELIAFTSLTGEGNDVICASYATGINLDLVFRSDNGTQFVEENAQINSLLFVVK